MLDPPQFHAAVSPGCMSLLLLMFAVVNLLFTGVRTIDELNLCKISALTPQRAVTTLGNQAIVKGCKRVLDDCESGSLSDVDVAAWAYSDDPVVFEALASGEAGHRTIGGLRKLPPVS